MCRFTLIVPLDGWICRFRLDTLVEVHVPQLVRFGGSRYPVEAIKVPFISISIMISLLAREMKLYA